MIGNWRAFGSESVLNAKDGRTSLIEALLRRPR